MLSVCIHPSKLTGILLISLLALAGCSTGGGSSSGGGVTAPTAITVKPALWKSLEAIAWPKWASMKLAGKMPAKVAMAKRQVLSCVRPAA